MDAITIIASVPAIVALVTLAKKLGLNGQASLVLAVALGVVINTANYYLGSNGGYQAAVQGLILGLSAAGLYDVAKTASSTAYNLTVTEPKTAAAAPKSVRKVSKPTK